MFSAINDYRPWEAWETQGLADFHQLISPGNPPLLTPVDIAEQYIVVQWELFAYLPWITYYGTWDFDNMEGYPARISHLSKSVRIDRQEGILAAPGEPLVRLRTLDVLNSKDSEHYEFEQNSSDFHLILNSNTNDAFLLDSRAYHSTAVQLLIRRPVSELAQNDLRFVGALTFSAHPGYRFSAYAGRAVYH